MGNLPVSIEKYKQVQNHGKKAHDHEADAAFADMLPPAKAASRHR